MVREMKTTSLPKEKVDELVAAEVRRINREAQKETFNKSLGRLVKRAHKQGYALSEQRGTGLEDRFYFWDRSG